MMNIQTQVGRSSVAALLFAALSVWVTVVEATDFVGAGSTFVNPVMLRWASRDRATTSAELTYRSVGSGAGVQRVKSGSVTFGATDRPLRTEELQAAGLAQFPLVIGVA